MLTVIERDFEHTKNENNRNVYWKCLCDCGNYTTVMGRCLRKGEIKSCGCLRRIKERKHNEYDLSGEYGIGYTKSGQSFIFDLEDYDLIKEYSWSINNGGYVVYHHKTHVIMHRLVTGCPEGMEVDHINHCRSDNRKANLRICTTQQNIRNRLSPSNKSGVIGVRQRKNGKWGAYISIDYKMYWLGTYDDKEDAIKARLKAEKECFGEFSLQTHLYEQYGI